MSYQDREHIIEAAKNVVRTWRKPQDALKEVNMGIALALLSQALEKEGGK